MTIRFIKSDRDEALLEVDSAGAHRLLAELRSVEGDLKTSAGLDVEFDSALLGKRRGVERTQLRFGLTGPGVGDGQWTRTEEGVLWNLADSENEVEFAISTLETAVGRGYFSPAEFLMVSRPGGSLCRIVARWTEGAAGD